VRIFRTVAVFSIGSNASMSSMLSSAKLVDADLGQGRIEFDHAIRDL
jgi:hypothetical protein